LDQTIKLIVDFTPNAVLKKLVRTMIKLVVTAWRDLEPIIKSAPEP